MKKKKKICKVGGNVNQVCKLKQEIHAALLINLGIIINMIAN